MKNLIKILIIVSSFSCKAQNPIIPIESRDGTRINGAYYKDTNNVFNGFEGTWLYTNGNTQLKIVLVKKIVSPFGTYFEDLLIGEYQYIKDGQPLVNTLSNLTNSYPNHHYHSINGNGIVTTPDLLNCTDCAPNEKRVSLGFTDALVDWSGFMIFKKTTVNGQEALKLYIRYISKSVVEGEIVPQQTITYGWYTLIKQ
jgi:hypothetical protein